MSHQITEIDKFLAFMNKLLKKELAQREISRLEKINIKVAIYDIFQRNFSIESIYYELLDYLEEDKKLNSFIPAIKEYYTNQST